MGEPRLPRLRAKFMPGEDLVNRRGVRQAASNARPPSGPRGWRQRQKNARDRILNLLYLRERGPKKT